MPYNLQLETITRMRSPHKAPTDSGGKWQINSVNKSKTTWDQMTISVTLNEYLHVFVLSINKNGVFTKFAYYLIAAKLRNDFAL